MQNCKSQINSHEEITCTAPEALSKHTHLRLQACVDFGIRRVVMILSYLKPKDAKL